MSEPKAFRLPFIKKEKVAKDTYSFYFNQAELGLDFIPGQYIRMNLPIANPDERGVSRQFTIASSPLEKNHIMITTKIIKASFKKKLLTLQIGEMVDFFGPLGGFIFDETKKEERVFLAGGIGITPFHSMIAYANGKNLSIPITLFVSFSTVDEMVFYEEMMGIANKNPNIKIVYTITKPEESQEKWNGEVGRISGVLIKKYVSDIFKPLYYIVGPPLMVSEIEETVIKMGISNNKIFIENFTGY